MKILKQMSATVAMVALAAGAARAQQVDSTEVVPLQPVLIEVLRTPFPLIDAPYAIAVNTQEQIQVARPGLGMEEALGGIPGLQVDDRYNYALGDRISVRGFGARTQFGVRGVTVLVDGIPATLADGQTNLNHVDLGFLRRAEVLRGPAASLYGGNAMGGVIQMETELPPPATFSQEFGVVGGEDGLLRFHSRTGGQVGETGYLFSLNRLTYDGFRDFQNAENLQLNGSLRSAAFGGNLRISGAYVDYDANNPGSLNTDLLAADRTQAYSNNVRQQTGENGNQGQLGAFWSKDIGAGELEIAGYGITREILNPIPPSIIDLNRTAGGLRGMFSSRVGAPAAGISWAVGAEADLQADDRKNYANNQGVEGATLLDQDETVRSGAVFGQVTANLIERLTAVAGLRYDVTQFEVTDRLLSDNVDDSGDLSMDAISPSFGLSYHVSNPLTLYGNVSSGFETPTTSELANRPSGAGGFNEDLQEQTAVSYEIGAKGLIDSRVSYQVSAYRANVDNALIPFEVEGIEGRSFFRNAGSAIHQGVEAGLTVSPLRGLRANVAYTYLDARFDDYVVDGQSYNDNMIPGVSPNRLDAALSYTAPMGWFASIEGRYSDETPVNDRNTATSPSYTVFDARAGLQSFTLSSVDIEPFAGVTNLFDEEYNTAVTVNAFGGRFYEPGPGRAFYAGANIRLNVQ